MVHRDVKPANILLTADGRAKVADLGIAKNYAHDAGLTLTGQVMGTPLYMAPEQLRGEPVSVSADIYAAGAVLYELLAGVPPVVGRSLVEIVLAHESGSVRPLAEAAPLVPERVSGAVMRALSKAAIARPASAADLAHALKSALPGRTPPAIAGTAGLPAATDLADAPYVRCAVCTDTLEVRPSVACAACQTPVHADCRERTGGCAQLTCSASAAARQRMSQAIALVESARLIRQLFAVGGAGVVVGMWPAAWPVAVLVVAAWLWRFRAMRRGLHSHAGLVPQERLARDFQSLLARYTNTLSTRTPPPMRPGFLSAWRAWATGAAVVLAVGLVLWVLFVPHITPIDASMVLLVLLGGQLAVLEFLLPVHLLRWLVWRQAHFLHEASLTVAEWRAAAVPVLPAARRDPAVARTAPLSHRG